MFRSLASVVFLTLSVTACGREIAPNSAPPPAQNAAPAQQSTKPAPAQTPESREATAAQESAGETTPEERSETALERLAALPAEQQLPDGRWKAGVNYKPFMPPQPTSVSAGKVEVVEVFWYGCPHCNALEPYLASWVKNKPDYIELVRIPVMWSAGHKAHAHLFYTLEALGRRDLHQRVFATIHEEKNPLLGKDEAESIKLMVAFARSNGIEEKQFMDAWNSFGVASNLQRAEQLTQRYRVEGVPMIVVNGKYATDVSMAGSPGNLIALIDDLAASEKRH